MHIEREETMPQYLFSNKDYTHVVEASSVAVARAFAREHIARQGFGRMAYDGLVEHTVTATFIYLWRVTPSWHPEAEDRKRQAQAERGSVACATCGQQMNIRSGHCFSAWYCSDACVPRS
jgi:hypothetical protein